MQGVRPLLLRRLRRALQLAIPGIVAADTVRSCFVTYQLAQERLKEWEEEDNEATIQEVKALLRAVVTSCASQNKDFWPAGLTLEAVSTQHGVSAAGDSEAEAGQAGADIWQLLGLGPSPATTTSGSHSVVNESAAAQAAPPHPTAASQERSKEAEQQRWAAAAAEEQEQLVRFERRQQEAAEAAVARQVQQRAAVVVVTFQEAVSHVASNIASLQLPWSTLMSPPPPPGVVRVTLADVVSILGDTRPARAAASKGGALRQRLLQAADATRDSLRQSVPWPELEVSRKSALRCAVELRAMHWPGPPPEPLERDLACC